MDRSLNDRVKREIEKYFIKNGWRDIEVKVNNKIVDCCKTNFLGRIQYVTVEAIKNDKLERIRVVVKEAPKAENERKNLRFDLMYKREIMAYTKLFPIYKELQIELNEDSRYEFVDVYAYCEDDFEEFLILEDISNEYLVSKSKTEAATYEYTVAAMKELAKFHGLSYVFEKRKPNEFLNFKNNLSSVLYNEKISGLEGMSKFADLMADKIRNIYKDCEAYNALEKFSANTYSNICKRFAPGKYDVITHGDYWKTNILYKCMDEKITKIKVIDYQLMFICSPVRDLLYFLFLCTSQNTRRSYYNEFIDIYHQKLKEFLNVYNLDINEIFPRQALDEELKLRGAGILGIAIIQMVFATCLGDEIIDTAETLSGKVLEDPNSPGAMLFQDRFKGVLEDCYYYGYI